MVKERAVGSLAFLPSGQRVGGRSTRYFHFYKKLLKVGQVSAPLSESRAQTPAAATAATAAAAAAAAAPA